MNTLTLTSLALVSAVLLAACGGKAATLSERASSLPDASSSPPSTEGDSGALDDAASEQETGGLDAGAATDPWDASDIDASLVTPCLSDGTILVVDTEGGDSGVPGLHTIDGSQATWSSTILSGLRLDVDAVPEEGNEPTYGSEWGFVINGDPTASQPLATGSYVSSGDGHSLYAAVAVDGAGCPGIPTGSFTIAELEWDGSDQSTVEKLLAWFDLTCPNGGVARGCISYGR